MQADRTAASAEAPPARQARLSDLLARVALGDRVAFRTLYDETGAHLLGVILRIQRDRGVAEDVLQEVYVAIWQAAKSYNPGLSQASTWMNSVARNRAIDSLRRAQAQPRTVDFGPLDGDQEDHDMLQQIPSDAPGPLDLLEQASNAHALQQCMKALQTPQRACLALAYYQGLSHTEVADQLGHPPGTVKSWVRRGLQSLKQCLERASTVWS